MRRIRFIITATFLVASLTVLSDGNKAQAGFLPEPETVSIGTGYSEAFGSDHAMAFWVDAQFIPMAWKLRPWIGGFFTTDESFFAGIGATWTLQGSGTSLFASIGLSGGYYHQGDGPDLGCDFEFMSFVEAGWRFENGLKLGMRLTHLSNAGIRPHNPGTELLSLHFMFPLGP